MSEMSEFETLFPVNAHFDAIAETNTERVLNAFHAHRLSDTHFAGTTGYGYHDSGREVLDHVLADLMGAEDAILRVQFVGGTHAIACALRAVVPPGEAYLAIGEPYDTLQPLMPYTVCPVDANGWPQTESFATQLAQSPCAILIQRSRGYSDHAALPICVIDALISAIKDLSPKTIVVVDNCYGEFCETREPCAVGADLCAGSLIKNPGGGLAMTGGYVAGRADLVTRAAEALTAPGIGRETGCSLGQNRLFAQGLFMAPHVVAGALKTAAFAAYHLEALGYSVAPKARDLRSDIIQTIDFGAPEPLLAFVKGIQTGSPVDSFVTPEPWDMPGYHDPVVMAAGTFVQGSSLELSCDAPLRPPYRAFLQGGLTYEAGKLGVLRAVAALMD